MGPRAEKDGRRRVKGVYTEWHREAGRRGGAATATKYGREHFSMLGKKGGRVAAERYGPEFYRAIGKKGGDVIREVYGMRFYTFIGRLGNAAQAAARTPKPQGK